MARPPSILIVGSGPSGLTAAIELTRRGHNVRLIDKAEGPAPQSRAIAINPRSLEILEPCGATALIVEQGIKIKAGHIFEPPKKLFTINFTRLDHRFNFLIALPQSQTERVLIGVLKQLGIVPEWQTELLDLEQTADKITCTLRNAKNEQETINPTIVIGTDGAHSCVRKSLGIDFIGDVYPHDWGLADVRLSGHVQENHVGAYLADNTICGIIPLGGDMYRLVSDQPDVLKALPDGISIEEIIWESRFRISHRQVETYQRGNVFLAGDAAHIHSPVGGRGMNLGIEDAATLAYLIDQNRTSEYNDMRWPVGNKVLRDTEQQTQTLSNRTFMIRMVMRYLMPLIVKTPLMLKNIREMMGVSTPTPEWLIKK